MALVKNRIEAWGERHLKNKDVRKILQYLISKRGMTERDLADKFDCTVPAVRYWLKDGKMLNPKSTFEERIQELGYKSLRDFFTRPGNRNGEKTLKQLAKETGFCYPTVSKWRREFLAQNGLCLENR
jgi:transposase